VHPGGQQLLLSGTSSKLGKSVLIGTLPCDPLLRNPNRILDWDPCIQLAARQATAAVIRGPAKATVSIDWDLPLTSPAVAKSLNGY
jgi:hypothetical protein